MAVISGGSILVADLVMRRMGKLVLYHRKRAGLSRLALADLAGVGKTTVFDIENGKTTVQVQSLVAVLGVLNIRIEANGPFSGEFASQEALRD